MGKLKNTKLKNKDALEFVLVNRGMDDPNYQNPDAPSRILLHVPKEEEEINEKHEQMLNQIPEMNRGVYSEKTIQNDLRELGIETLHGDMDYETLKNTVDKLNKEKFVNKIHDGLMGKEGNEEEVDTNILESHKLQSGKKDELDEKKIDELLKRAKISAEITEYNKFGLRKDIDPEVLKYVTDKEFVEGVDIFIPAPMGTQIEGNRFDIDIPVEQMNDDYKEVFDAMKSDDEAFEGELEDDIVLLANEGVLPIEIGHQTSKDKFLNEDKDEMILTETQDRNKNPTYKYITKEEKEFLDKQFTKTMKEYENKDQIKTGGYIPKEIMEEAMNELIGVRGDKNNKKSNFKGLTKKFEDEEEYEDYEFDEDGDQEQFAEEYEEYSEEEEIVDTRKKNKKNSDDQDSACNKSENEDKVEYFENNFKIDYQDGEKKQNKKGKKPPRKPLSKRNDTEIFTIDDLNKLVHDERFVESTIILQEEKEKNPQEENMEGIPVYYPKKRLDITTVHGKVGVLPKTVGEASVKLPKGSFKPTNEHDESKIKNHDSQGKSIVLNSNKPIIPSTLGEETKEEKKLRKKLVKEEKSEKRKQKKELKTAFQVRIILGKIVLIIFFKFFIFINKFNNFTILNYFYIY